ncbi:hypothetical protein HY025_05750 [Candidatus Daviesbacteria bacterium]|nr:hypothetical protein [Candidatus Daviesbacteria bacterium]
MVERKERKLSRKERLLLEQARGNLRRITDTPEDLFHDPEDLMNLVGIDPQTLAESFRIVGRELLKKYSRVIGAYVIRKPSQLGVATLVAEPEEELSAFNPRVELSAGGIATGLADSVLIRCSLPLGQDSRSLTLGFFYKDFGISISAEDYARNPSIESFRLLWGGIRWMAANMVSWEEYFLVMPPHTRPRRSSQMFSESP